MQDLYNLMFFWPCIMNLIYIIPTWCADYYLLIKYNSPLHVSEPQVLIFRRIQLYTCSIWYCHSLWEYVVACLYTAWVLTQAVYRQATTNSRGEWRYHMPHVYNCIVLKMSTWISKHVEENNILWTNINQCIKLVLIYSQDVYSCAYRIIEIYTRLITKGVMSPKGSKVVFIIKTPLTYKKFSAADKRNLEQRS